MINLVSYNLNFETKDSADKRQKLVKEKVFLSCQNIIYIQCNITH